MNGNLIIINSPEVVTVSGFAAKKGKEMSELSIIKNGGVVVENGIIADVGESSELIKSYESKKYKIIDASGKAVLPGFVDSHTHFVFGGYRADEFSLRLSGKNYMDIMKKGGGILSSVRETRKASIEEMTVSGLKRLDSMISFGVTTVEGKSGYGLDRDCEIKQLEVMSHLNKIHPMDIAATFLGAHAVLPEYKGKEDYFIDFLISDVLPEISERKLAEFCDVFCEKNVFNIDQSRKMLEAAKKEGLGLKIHGDEIVTTGGTELAAELGAVSADHLLSASDNGIKLLSEKNVVATLLPGTAFCLKENFARARFMIENNCAVALATELNPGSCFTESIPLVIGLATLYMGLKAEEAVTALTINGAAAINKAQTIGSIDKGKKGDLIILEYPSYKFLPYHTGVNSVETVIKDGNVVYNKSDKVENLKC